MNNRWIIANILIISLINSSNIKPEKNALEQLNNNKPVVKYELSTKTNAKDKTSTKSKPDNRLKMPLQNYEMLGVYSVESTIDRFGDFNYHETAYYFGNSSEYIKLNYDNLVVEFEYGDNVLKRKDEDGFTYGDRNIKLTEAMIKEEGRLLAVLITDDSVLAARGTRVGDSVESVKGAFLDLSQKYGNGIDIYKSTDVYPANYKDIETFPVYGEIIKDKESLSGVSMYLEYLTDKKKRFDFDCIIRYRTSLLPSKIIHSNKSGMQDDFYEEVTYFIKNNKVVAILQKSFTNQP